MKLRNKKTGQIVELELVVRNNDYLKDVIVETFYNEEPTIKKLYEDWEDYEEPKEYWYIDYCGCICNSKEDPVSPVFMLKEIGNYFSSKEEAEKAVEKLKAWKRLKDKGFRFTAWYGGSKNISYEITSLENKTYIPRQICDDLDLLFGGEE